MLIILGLAIYVTVAIGLILSIYELFVWRDRE